MSYKKVFWGVILVFIGVMFMLRNLDIFYFDWSSIWYLWPLLIILWGVSILPIKGFYKLILSIIFIVLGLLLYKNQVLDNPSYDRYIEWNYDDEDWSEEDDDWMDDDFDVLDDSNRTHRSKGHHNSKGIMNVPFEYVDCASISFEAGAGLFILSSTTQDDLIFITKKASHQIKYSLTSQNNGDCQNVKLKMETNNKITTNSKNRVNIKLNPIPEWSMDFDIGAAKLDLDLSSYKLKEIDIDGGASDINLTLGDLSNNTVVDIDTGMSQIDINIPSSVGAVIDVESVLSSKSFKDFSKRDGKYYSSNYDTSRKKIIISIDAGMSDININYYDK